MSTGIGGFSTANGIENLVIDIKRMFERSKQQFSIWGLISVPDHLHKLDEQAFTPLLISIGPIHRSNAKFQTMKKCQLRFCECFIKQANINLQDLVYTTGMREKEIRSYYVETIVSSIISDDFVTMIVVDGMFILEYFLRQSNPHLVGNDTIIAELMPPILKFDLVLLENQLPFFVLEMLFKQANFPTELGLKPLPLKELAFDFFQCYKFQTMAPWSFYVQIEHLTNLLRFFYLSEQLPFRRPGGAKLSYSATQLHEAGVKFKGVKFDEEMGCYSGYSHFLDIRFDFNNGVLEIPCIKLNDEKIHLIQNIIALEQSHYVGQAYVIEHTYVIDFFVILNFLINTFKDVDLLCDKGILVNYLGNSNAAALVVNNLNTNILWDYMNSNYLEIRENLNAFYKKHWHKWKALLWCQYFSTPWRFASTSGAIVLLLLTAIQTVCSLKFTTW